MTFGEYLREVRGNRSLQQLAQIAHIDKGYLSKIELDLRLPKIEMMEGLARAYGVDYAELLERRGFLVEDPEDQKMLIAFRRGLGKMDPQRKAKVMELLERNFDEFFNEDDQG